MMTEFENDTLQTLLEMKQKELLELINDDKCTLKKEALKELSDKCVELASHIFYVNTMKYKEI